MNAKHQFKYTYNETDLEEYSPLEVTFEVPATATITQMLNNFEQYLKACGYIFDGKLDIVEDGFDDTIWPSDSDGWSDGIGECTHTDCVGKSYETPEVEKNKWVHGVCNPPSADWNATKSQKEYVKGCESTSRKYASVQDMVNDLSNIKYNL